MRMLINAALQTKGLMLHEKKFVVFCHEMIEYSTNYCNLR